MHPLGGGRGARGGAVFPPLQAKHHVLLDREITWSERSRVKRGFHVIWAVSVVVLSDGSQLNELLWAKGRDGGRESWRERRRKREGGREGGLCNVSWSLSNPHKTSQPEGEPGPDHVLISFSPSLSLQCSSTQLITGQVHDEPLEEADDALTDEQRWFPQSVSGTFDVLPWRVL